MNSLVSRVLEFSSKDNVELPVDVVDLGNSDTQPQLVTPSGYSDTTTTHNARQNYLHDLADSMDGPTPTRESTGPKCCT